MKTASSLASTTVLVASLLAGPAPWAAAAPKGAPGSRSSRTGDAPFHRPYKRKTNNFLYNLLFCDEPALFRPKPLPAAGSFAVLFSPTPRLADVQRIANDENEESRLRVLAFNYLRSKKVEVPTKQLLGVIVEVPLDGGLDTLAVFADGRMRYINHSEKLAVFESTPADMEDAREKVMAAAAAAVAKTGPWDRRRLPPPAPGRLRVTFLVSDGLYFGEGPSAAIARDAVGGPVFRAAADLLTRIVSATAQ